MVTTNSISIDKGSLQDAWSYVYEVNGIAYISMAILDPESSSVINGKFDQKRNFLTRIPALLLLNNQAVGVGLVQFQDSSFVINTNNIKHDWIMINGFSHL